MLSDDVLKQLLKDFCGDYLSHVAMIPLLQAVDKASVSAAIPEGCGVWMEEECQCWSEESVAGKKLDYDVRTKEWIPIDCKNCKGTGRVPVERVS